jgi:LysM repeat protein/GH24 family phage-related lysozyme (muramidase)
VPYTVKSGDTMSEIAARLGITVSALLAINPLCRGNPDLLHIGQSLNLPGERPVPQTPLAIAGVSDTALQLILRCEVSGAQEYNLHYQAPSWPQGESGVTIGIGYDLGYVSASQFRADWASRLQDDVIARLSTVCGITGAAAQCHIASLSDVAVPWPAAESMFRIRTIPEYASRTRQALDNTDLLSPDSFGALVSLVYNRGAAFTAAGDRYTEMRAIHACMAARDFAAIPAQIRAMKRLWQNQPGMAGLVARREQEASLFEAGLQQAAPQAAESLSPSG